jgi:hypothetical protein
MSFAAIFFATCHSAALNGRTKKILFHEDSEILLRIIRIDHGKAIAHTIFNNSIRLSSSVPDTQTIVHIHSRYHYIPRKAGKVMQEN